jgi:hypothetical protein
MRSMKKTILALAMAAMALPSVPAMARPHHGHHNRYDSHGRYYQPQRLSRHDHVWRGRDGRYYCKRDNGTTGLIIGAAAGALLGRSLDGGRDRTVGTLLGGAGGALLGRSIDRGDLKCR